MLKVPSSPATFRNPITLISGAMFFMCSMVIPALHAQTMSLQVIHAAEGESLEVLDVYVNKERVINDLARNTASPFLTGIPVQVGFPVEITLAPSTSTSASEGFFTSFASVQYEGRNTIAIIGNPESASRPLDILTYQGAQILATDASKTAVSFLHAATKASPLDAVLREGGTMVFGALGYGAYTPYLNLAPEDLYLDVKVSGTSNILSTYRLSLGPYKGQAFQVYISGDMLNASSLKMYAVYSDGLVIPVDFAPVARVQYFNALADTVDVYKNGTKFSNDAAPGGAMPYKYVPAAIPMNIAVSPYTSFNGNNAYAKFPFTFENMKTYAAVSAGIRDDAQHPLQMFFYDGAREKATDTSSVDLLFFQGDPFWSKVDVRISQFNDLFAGVSYGDFKGYQRLVAVGTLTLRVYEFGTMHLLAEFAPMDLAAYKGQTLTLFVKSGAQSGDAELWAARADGSSVQMQSTVSSAEVPGVAEVIRLYPNPVHGVELQVQMEGVLHERVEYRVVDAYGRMLLSGGIAVMERNGQCAVDVSQLPAGLYFLEIMTPESRSAVRFRKI